ncbi:protein PATRONUS [Salix suchowensis]|nr:protein PATRONUS [Salix suchowensis]
MLCPNFIQTNNRNISLNSFTARMASLVSRRTPLGYLSNSMKAVASRIPHDASKMKSFSKAPGKWQTAGRKPLSEISNSRKPETKKRSFNAKKLPVLTEESDQTSAIAVEKCLHNHQECVEAQTRAMDINEFQLAAPCSPLASITKMKPPRPLQLEATVEQLPKDQSWEFNLDSPSPFRTPISQMNYRDWKDLDCCISFKLIETPEWPKH